MRANNSNSTAWLVAIILLLSGSVAFLLIGEISYSQNSFVIQSTQITRLAYTILATVILTTMLTLFIYKRKRKQRIEFQRVLKQYHDIFMQSRDAFISTDFNLNVISWNKGAEQMYGYTEKEAIGNKLFNLIKSDVTDNKKYEVWVQLKQNGFWKDIIKQHTTHKKSITALISIAAIKDDKTKLITGFTGICTDITFQKKAEERIGQLALMVESSNDAIIVFNEDLEITNWNKGAERLYGYTAEESEGKIIPEFLAKQTSSKFLADTLKNLTIGGYWKSEDLHFKKNGQPLNVFVSFSPFKWENNQNIYVGIITDITEQKEVEKKLLDFNKALEEKVEEKTAEMREIFDRVDWGFCAFNVNDEYIFINPKASELLHKKKEEVLGKNGWSVFPNVENEFRNAYYKSIQTQKTQYCEFFSKSLNIWIASYFFPSETGVSIYFRDITYNRRNQTA